MQFFTFYYLFTMTKQDYLKQFKEVTDKMYSITDKKGSDYSWENDVFKNFELCERRGIETSDWMFVRMLDKVSRIGELLHRENKVADEKLEDTLIDLANYSLILFIYLKNKQLRCIQ